MPKKSQSKISPSEVSEQFSKDKYKYDTLGTNLVQALKLFLTEKDLKVLSVEFRTKDKDSFVEKIERKNYENPFDEIEDICGIRIICYQLSDVDKISEIISKEFEVLEKQDKVDLLKANQFGYRSTHFIVKIKNEWLKAPNYRNLENLKAEIQIRTVLMHAWAEIEHKLAYKKESDIPEQFRKTFSQLAAILENADEQFEELKNKITDYREGIVEISKNESDEIREVELNLDSLQAYLDAIFPNKSKDINHTAVLLDDFINYEISLDELKILYERAKSYLSEINKEFGWGYSQVGSARLVLDTLHPNYATKRKLPDILRQRNIKWKDIIEQNEANKTSK